MPETRTAFCNGRHLTRLDAARLPTDDNPVGAHEARNILGGADLIRQREEVEEGTAVDDISLLLLQASPRLALLRALEDIGHQELGLQRLAVQEELVAQLHQRRLDVQPRQLLRWHTLGD